MDNNFNFDYENTVFARNSNGDLTKMYEVGKYYKIRTVDGVKHIKYLGRFYNINEVPLENCMYVIDNVLYFREIDYDQLLKSTMFQEGVQKHNKIIKIDKDDKPLPTQPNINDNILLILLKLLMQYRGLTENGFKNLFDNTSEMNNMKRLIFHGNGALSWQKFIDMTNKLNTSVIIQIIDKNKNELDKDGDLIASNNLSDETKMPLPDVNMISNNN